MVYVLHSLHTHSMQLNILSERFDFIYHTYNTYNIEYVTYETSAVLIMSLEATAVE